MRRWLSDLPLPLPQVAALWACNFAQAVMLTLPFTVAVFMVRNFEAGEQMDEARIGRLTGLLAALYSFTQCTTSLPWGVVSNRIGRKPIIVIGLGTNVVAQLWFGLSPSYGWAAAARVVSGLLNGVVGAWKVMLGETCDAAGQGKLFGYLSMAWGVGSIAGPAIGGAFSQPCRWRGAPLCGEGQLLAARPYFLPCLLGALASLVAFILNCALLEESHPQLVSEGRRRGYHGSRAGYAAVATADVEEGAHGLVLTPLKYAAKADIELTPLVPASGTKTGRSLSANKSGTGAPSAAAIQAAAVAAGEGIPTGLRELQMQYSIRASDASYRQIQAYSGAGGGSDEPAASLPASAAVAAARPSSGAPDPATPPSKLQPPWARFKQELVHQLQQVSPQLSRQLAKHDSVSSLASMPHGGGGGGGGGGALSLPSSPSTSSADASYHHHHHHHHSPQQPQQQQQQRIGAIREGSGELQLEIDDDDDGGADVRHGAGGGRGGRGSLRRGLRRVGTGFRAALKKVEAKVADLRQGGEDGDRPRPREHVARWVARAKKAAANKLGRRGRQAGDGGYGEEDDEGDYEGAGLTAADAAAETTSLLQQALPSAGPAASAAATADASSFFSGGTRGPKAPCPNQAAAAPKLPVSFAASAAALASAVSATPSAGARPGSTSPSSSPPPPPTTTPTPWMRDRQVLLSLGGYALVALFYCAVDEVLPIMAAAPQSQGGLDMAEEDLALPLMWQGVVTIVFSVWGFPRMQRRFGTRRTAITGLWMGAVVCMLLPTVAQIVASWRMSQALLYLTMLIKAVSQSAAFTAAIIMVNAAPSSPGQLAVVNGVGQTLASFVRGVGPAMGGVLWAVSLGLQSSGQQFLSYGIVASSALGALIVYYVVRVQKAH